MCSSSRAYWVLEREGSWVPLRSASISTSNPLKCSFIPPLNLFFNIILQLINHHLALLSSRSLSSIIISPAIAMPCGFAKPSATISCSLPYSWAIVNTECNKVCCPTSTVISTVCKSFCLPTVNNFDSLKLFHSSWTPYSTSYFPLERWLHFFFMKEIEITD